MIHRRTVAALVATIISMSTITFFAFKQDFSMPHELPFVVVIPSYNNEKWVDKNLRSVYSQNYTNYRVIYYNDNSTDQTSAKARAIAAELNQEHRTTIVDNPERRGVMANLYEAIHACHDRAIIVDLDGDDWLKHDQVLAKLNQVYLDHQDGKPAVWMTYGQFEEYPGGRVGFCRALPDWVIANNSYRQFEWVTTHLRTFYAGLFKRIAPEDFMYKGEFFPSSSDRAFIYPLAEMAGIHSRFIPDILYVYNVVNPINDFKVRVRLQLECCQYIQALPRYAPLSEQEFAQPSETYKRQ